jgi:vacuolar-type H+-ATPase subunit D/Vma8
VADVPLARRELEDALRRAKNAKAYAATLKSAADSVLLEATAVEARVLNALQALTDEDDSYRATAAAAAAAAAAARK